MDAMPSLATLPLNQIVFYVLAFVSIVSALQVVFQKSPLYAALNLIVTLVSLALIFAQLSAGFLAAVQVIVYAGAIVVLFLFVIMLLGVDRADDLGVEPIAGQRPIAVAVGIAAFVLGIVFVVVSTDGATGARAAVEPVSDTSSNITQLARVLFTDYVFAFELTGVLLTVAVVGAVVLSRRPTGELQPVPDAPADDEPEDET